MPGKVSSEMSSIDALHDQVDKEPYMTENTSTSATKTCTTANKERKHPFKHELLHYQSRGNTQQDRQQGQT